MIELFETVDPAKDLKANTEELRSLVDEKVGISVRMTPENPRSWRAWSIAAAAFVVVLVAVTPLLFRPDPINPFETTFGSFVGIAGIDRSIPLVSGGVQTMDIDGDTIWVVSAVATTLQKVSTSSGEIEESYEIEEHVEGVVAGGSYIWMNSYDNGGEVLRFDPDAERVDRTIPINGPPGLSSWFGDRLWVSNQNGDLFELSADGEILSTSRGDVKGQGLGYLWINDPDTGLISSVSTDGTIGEMVIPTVEGVDTISGRGVRQVAEAGGYLWLMDGDYPFGNNLSRFDPETGEFRSMGGYTFGLLDMIEFEGSLWVASHTDHLLLKVDPDSGEAVRYAVSGKVGGLSVVDDEMWATFYQPGGALVKLGPERDLVESGEVLFDDWNLYPHRFLCTGSSEEGRPTILLEPFDWIDYGSWSVVQAQLAASGYVVCANGYVEGETTPAQRAADLTKALDESGLPGPYVLVGAGDGAHSVRLFADGRTDVAGVVLVDPMPLGFGTFYDDLLPGWGHPPWHDLDESESVALGDLGEIPLTIIDQDPSAVFGSNRFIAGTGRENAAALDEYWQDGLGFYRSLSTNSSLVLATGSGLDAIVSTKPDLIVSAVLDLLAGDR